MKKHIAKTILALTFFSLFFCAAQSQLTSEQLKSLEPVTLYKTYDDFQTKKPMGSGYGILIKEKGDKYFTIKGVYNLETGKSVKNGTAAWAINYNNNNYFNLNYSNDVNNRLSYAKLDIEGKYCAIIIEENDPDALQFKAKNYGGGLAGALMSNAPKWGKNWKTKDGKKIKILFIDDLKFETKAMSKNEHYGNYLTREQVENLLKKTGTNLNGEKVKDIEVDKIIELIKLANEK